MWQELVTRKKFTMRLNETTRENQAEIRNVVNSTSDRLYSQDCIHKNGQRFETKLTVR